MPHRPTSSLRILLVFSLSLLLLLASCDETTKPADSSNSLNGEISGQVYDAETLTALDGVNLTTAPQTKSLTSGPGPDSEDHGYYRFSKLAKKPYTIKASKPGYIDKFVKVDLTGGGEVIANIHLLPNRGMENPSDELLLHYTFADGVRDTSGNKNHGNDTTAQPVYDRWAREDQALGCAGGMDYIISTRPISVGPEFSVVLWVYREPGGGEGIFMLEENADRCARGYGLALEADGSLNILDAGCPQEVIPANVTIGANCWHMVALVVQEKQLYLYVDGFPAGYPLPAVPVSNFQLALGAVPCAAPAIESGAFRGQIDDVQVYNSALPPDVIRSLYGAYDCVP